MDLDWQVIADGIRIAKRKIATAEKNLEVVRAEAEEQIAKLQATCPHPQTRYIPDAAGGSDHYDVCKLCDAEL